MRKLAGDILIVEDDPHIRHLLREFLQSRGLRVSEARNGEEAIEMAVKVLPKVILLDLFMPIKDGYATARHLRWIAALRFVPIIVMSAYGDLAIRFFKDIDVLGSGSIEYLAKPFDPIHLGELLDNML